MALLYILFFIQVHKVSAEFVLWRLGESQSVHLSCQLLEHKNRSGLHLYHLSTPRQTTLLSLDRGGTPRINPKHRGRLLVSGGLDSVQVNVTLLHLEQSDTGLYVWEISLIEKNASEHIASAQKFFLLVEKTEKLCQCSFVYPPLLFTISAAAGLILVITCWLAIDHCVKLKKHDKLRLSAPIYVEMTRKHQTTGVAQNIPESPSHLEEANFPVYANQNFRQPQDYYASPRQLVLKAA